MKTVKFFEKCNEIARKSESETEFEQAVFELAQDNNMLYIYDKHYILLRNIFFETKDVDD